MFINWLGNKWSTMCARYFPDYCATVKAGLKGLSTNLSYKVVLVNIKSPTEPAINPRSDVIV